jgi:hypothetical protein
MGYNKYNGKKQFRRKKKKINVSQKVQLSKKVSYHPAIKRNNPTIIRKRRKVKAKSYRDILKPRDIERCKEAFMAFDIKKRGRLGVFEIRKLLEDIGQNPTEE